MKSKLFLMLVFVFVFTTQAQIKTPQPSPSSKVEQAIGLTDATLEYSRPSMRGRVVYGNLVPYGKTWRTGANANTKITFSTDVTIDGKSLKKGTYAVYTIPNIDSWDIMFYSDASNWGLPQKWDDEKVALKTSVKPETMPFKLETFEMGFEGLADPNQGSLYILWESTMVTININVPTDKTAFESIEKTMAGPSANDYFNAGRYYHQSGKDINKSLKYVSKATDMNPEAWWMFREKSLIQAEMGDKKGAIASAQKSLAGAEKAGNADYVKMNKESIAEWSK